MSHHQSIHYFNAEAPSEKIRLFLKPVESFADSFGLKPFRIIVSRNHGSHLFHTIDDDKEPAENWTLIIAVRNQITRSDIDLFVNNVSESKKYFAVSLNKYRKGFEESINKKGDLGENWAERQARSGLAILLASALQVNVHTRVLEITDHAGFDDVFGDLNKAYTAKFSVEVEWILKNGAFVKNNNNTNTALVN
ncbi:MAG: hypothetical protein C5B59_00335 [Bacteroidetes bacterium]|nr:MAG: hypothetical protein C5B59_00335 [Bacteroidota bacterium]